MTSLAVAALLTALAVPSNEPIATTVPAAGLAADLEVLEEAYRSLHPGLYRYSTADEIDRRFDELSAKLNGDRTRREAYLALAEFLASIRCGHTYANFWNQSEEVQRELFDTADKVPFTFRLLGDEMVVTRSAAANAALVPGTVIRSIDEVPVGAIIKRLLPLVHADGTSDLPRLFALGVSGIGDWEPFDVYFPLLFPPRDLRYRIEALPPGVAEVQRFWVDAVSRSERRELLTERYGPMAESPDDLWAFEIRADGIAYLKAGSFVTWKMMLDWRTFLEGAFSQLRERKVGRLIVDVRGNSGGDNDVLAALLGYLLPRAVSIPPRRELLRYEVVPERLAPHLDTWDPSFKDRRGQVEPTRDGFYTWKKGVGPPVTVGGSDIAFRGKVLLLVDPSNSSATFTLARILKDSGAATLVGAPTGGNRRGINGGQMFFLRLPNSGLEVDIPLVGYYPEGEEPDRGVLPHVSIRETAADIARAADPVLNAAIALAREAEVP